MFFWNIFVSTRARQDFGVTVYILELAWKLTEAALRNIQKLENPEELPSGVANYVSIQVVPFDSQGNTAEVTTNQSFSHRF